MQYAKKTGYHMEAKYTMEIGGEMGEQILYFYQIMFL